MKGSTFVLPLDKLWEKRKKVKMFTSTNISDKVIYLSDVFEREIVRERELNCVFWIKNGYRSKDFVIQLLSETSFSHIGLTPFKSRKSACLLSCLFLTNFKKEAAAQYILPHSFFIDNRTISFVCLCLCYTTRLR